ncbi:rhodanese-like domain-containing protein [Natronomonas gomsonensis]|uniref:rhodanese-like domain-containing protein n=1 Tax=Natronomonas gomsonensis TaxID=1046043 RepID=UPI0015B820FE|nr:rhodanese-like domain-containing protein [Natronomonas gomsonensis]
MSNIRPNELADRLDSATDADPFLLDIRPERSFQSGAIENSHNVAVYDDLRGGDDATLRRHLHDIPMDREVIVICKMGVVAKRATSLLNEEGYDAVTLRGGMSGWRGYQNGSVSYKLRSLLWRLT